MDTHTSACPSERLPVFNFPVGRDAERPLSNHSYPWLLHLVQSAVTEPPSYRAECRGPDPVVSITSYGHNDGVAKHL